MNPRHSRQYAIFIILFLLLSACDAANTTPTLENPVQTIQPTEALPSPTPTEVVVYVATVNGEGIRESSYTTSLAQFNEAQAEFGNLLALNESAENRVIDSLIDRHLLSLAAREAGFTADETTVDARMNHLTEQAGGQEAIIAWMDRYGYSVTTFRIELGLEIEAAWQRDQVTNAVPLNAEQVKAKQIFFYDAYMATRAHGQLASGAPFENVSQANDPQNLGTLDWFPRGYLFFPELEAAAFSLPPGSFSEVIETEIGYHILFIQDYNPDRPLSSDARLTLQTKALEDWIALKREQSQIEIFLP